MGLGRRRPRTNLEAVAAVIVPLANDREQRDKTLTC